ncbi:MAG: hypothetical protein LBE83_07975, partial [Propionibacteriaceae bacterium]|nr:hypothetical protein [Propionibacteriaceae bacterium]
MIETEPLTEVFEGSRETWADPTGFATAVPENLLEAGKLPLWPLFWGFLSRHRTRRGLAEASYAASRNPERGLPIAENSAVFRFLA